MGHGHALSLLYGLLASLLLDKAMVSRSEKRQPLPKIKCHLKVTFPTVMNILHFQLGNILLRKGSFSLAQHFTLEFHLQM